MSFRPSDVFFYWEALDKIPETADYEQKMSQNLVQFAKHLGLKAVQEKNFNTLIQKPAQDGYEISPPVILQGQLHHKLGIAMMMAILANPNLSHPALSCLFTSTKGAPNLETPLTGTLINLNHPKFGEALVAAPGGRRLNLNLPITWAKPSQKHLVSYHIPIQNNVRHLGQTLKTLQRYDVSIFKIENGLLGLTLNHSVIPAVTKALRDLENSPTEINFQKTSLNSKVFSYYTVARFADLCQSLPSIQIDTLKTTDRAILLGSARIQQELPPKLKKIAQQNHATFELLDEFPSWNPNPNSPILLLMKDIYRRQTRQELALITSPICTDCNYFGDLDKISIGPTTGDLATVEPFYKLLLRILKEL